MHLLLPTRSPKAHTPNHSRLASQDANQLPPGHRRASRMPRRLIGQPQPAGQALAKELCLFLFF